MRIVTLPGVNRISIGYGWAMIAGMPLATQLSVGYVPDFVAGLHLPVIGELLRVRGHQ